jgi:outer membrane protein OmpA-like peptidoglycan-associated protein
MISIRWYVCGIYELCGEEAQPPISSQSVPPPKLAEEVLDEPYQAPLAFQWSSPDPMTNEGFEEFTDSIKKVFNESPTAIIEITGLYDKQELNNSSFENLGLARAENIKQLLLNSGVKRSYRIKSEKGDLSDGLSGSINDAYIFEAVPREERTDGFIISEARNKLVIHFVSNSALPESDQQVKMAIKKLAGNARKNQNRLLVIGHTDNQGDPLENKKLGLLRATKVKDLLLSYGMNEKSVLVESEGSDAPLVNNNTLRGRQQNRRVEIIII